MRASVVVMVTVVLASCAPTARVQPPDQIVIQVVLAGGSVDVIEATLLNPLEAAIAPLPGVAQLEGTAAAEHAVLVVKLTPGVDATAFAMQVDDAVAAARAMLPAGVSVDVRALPVVAATLRFVLPHGPSDALDRFIERQPGVIDVAPCGEVTPAVDVVLDPARLNAAGVDLMSVLHALEARDDPSPTVLGDLAVGNVRLADLADVKLGEWRTCFTSTSMGEGVATETVSVRTGTSLVDLVALAVGIAALAPDVKFLAAAHGVLVGTVELDEADDAFPARATEGLAGSLKRIAAVDWVAIARRRDDPASASLAIGLRAGSAPHTVAGNVADALANFHPHLGQLHLAGDDLGAIEITIAGPDAAAQCARATRAVTDLRAQSTLVWSAGATACVPRPVTTFAVDRGRAAELGVPVADIAATLRVVGSNDTEVQDRLMRAAPIRVFVSFGGGGDPARRLELVQVRSATGALVPLAMVVRMTETALPAAVHRVNLQRVITVWARPAPGASDAQVRAAMATALR